jgi:integrase
MPRPRPPHLHKQITRHSKIAWYVRIGKGRRIRLRAVYGSDEFRVEYDAAVNGRAPAKPGKPISGTLAWLIDQYRTTAVWTALSAATRRQRENIFKQVLKLAGVEPFAKITGKTIQAGIDRRSKTPHQARHFLDTMRGLFQWALDAEHIKADPTAGKSVVKPKTKGFPPWDEDEIERFEVRWPRGTRERVMFDIFCYTGLRRGDAARLGKQHVKNGMIRLDTEKTGTRVTIPVLSTLQKTLDAGPVGDLTFITTKTGKPMRKESIGNAFRDACRAAGIPKSAHGLRKASATRAANNGATVAELEAIFGWDGGRMASLYTKSADRERLATRAMEKLSRTSIPSPQGEVRENGRKG